MLNSINLQGNLTKDAEVKELKDGKKIALFSIANQRDKETTYFFSCKCFNEKVFPCLKKGTLIIVSGELTQKFWTDCEGVKKENIGITVYKVDFVPTSKKEEPKKESKEEEAEEDIWF